MRIELDLRAMLTVPFIRAKGRSRCEFERNLLLAHFYAAVPTRCATPFAARLTCTSDQTRAAYGSLVHIAERVGRCSLAVRTTRTAIHLGRRAATEG